jgi:hypothetical protein
MAKDSMHSGALERRMEASTDKLTMKALRITA